jgi:acyl-coenzyme A thioesterase PaaI-like protein
MTGSFAGWNSRAGEPFEDKSGPFFHRALDDGSVVGAFVADGSHVNGIGIVHGGCLLTLVDYTMFTVVKRAIGDGEAVTVSLVSEFVGAGAIGDFIEAHAEIIKAGRSMVFARGIVRARGKPLLTFSGAMKRLG